MIRFDDFRRNHTILTLVKASSSFDPIGTLSLPQGSLIHYIPTDKTSIGIDANDVLVSQYDGNITGMFMEEFIGKLSGTPQPIRGSSSARTIDLYHRQNTRIRKMRRVEATMQELNSLVVCNYGVLNAFFRYSTNMYMNVQRLHNILTTVANNINLNVKYGRTQFLQLEAPKALPEQPALMNVVERPNVEMIKSVALDEDIYFICCILTAIQKFGAIASAAKKERKDPDYTKVNKEVPFSAFLNLTQPAMKQMFLVVEDSGQWTSVNMLDLVEWYATDMQNTENAFYRLLEKVISLRAVAEEDDEEPSESSTDVPLITVGIDGSVEVNKDKTGESVTVATKDIGKASMQKEVARLVSVGALSPKAANNKSKIINATDNIENPFSDESLADFANLDEMRSVPIAPVTIRENVRGVIDKSMLQSRLTSRNQLYTEKYMTKHFMANMLALQNAGIQVTNVKAKHVKTAVDDMTVYNVQFTPLTGAASTYAIPMVNVRKDGSWTSSGVKQRTASQKSDRPLVKVSPWRVALKTDYGQAFVLRSQLAVCNQDKWFYGKIVELFETHDDNRVTLAQYGKAFEYDVELPRSMSILSQYFSAITLNGIDVALHAKKHEAILGKALYEQTQTDKLTYFGKKGTTIYLMDMSDVLYTISKTGEYEVVGLITEFLELPTEKMPLDVATIKIYGKDIPVVIALGTLLGFQELFKLIKLDYRLLPINERFSPEPDEVVFKFKDTKLIFKRGQPLASIVVSGLHLYRNIIRDYSYDSFHNVDVYLPVFEKAGLGNRHLVEIDLQNKLFIDPYARQQLIKLKLPQDYIGLVLKACSLLTNDRYWRGTDTTMINFRGYDRFAGFLYKELVNGARTYALKTPGPKTRFEINPNEPLRNVVVDQSNMIIEDSSPAHNLKEHATVTYGGSDGRSARTVNLVARLFDKNDIGVISEGTPDSGKAGYCTYFTMDPAFDDIFGNVKVTDMKKDNLHLSQRYLSPVGVISPCHDRNDTKRMFFTCIQISSMDRALGYSVAPVGTGGETTMSHYVDEKWALKAEEDGTIIEVGTNNLKMRMKDGTVVSKKVGEWVGVVAGTPSYNKLITDLKVGDKFKAGDIVAYSQEFYERSFFDSTQVSFKQGMRIFVALQETNGTLEDGSWINERVNEGLSTPITTRKTFFFSGASGITEMLKVGDEVEYNTILCTVADKMITDSKFFDASALEQLADKSATSQRAGTTGHIMSMEVLYKGDVSKMSPSVRKFVNAADQERAKLAKAIDGDNALTGEVTSNIRVDGTPLDDNMVAVTFYIVHLEKCGVGDKGTFDSMLKSIFGHVMTGINRTKGGIDLDAIIGFRTINDRIVLSPIYVGMLNVLLWIITKKHIALWTKQKH